MNKDTEQITSKWMWKMHYCKKQRIPLAQKWAWDKSEEAYNKRNAT